MGGAVVVVSVVAPEGGVHVAVAVTIRRRAIDVGAAAILIDAIAALLRRAGVNAAVEVVAVPASRADVVVSVAIAIVSARAIAVRAILIDAVAARSKAPGWIDGSRSLQSSGGENPSASPSAFVAQSVAEPSQSSSTRSAQISQFPGNRARL